MIGPEGHHKSILYKFGQICATGNDPMHQFYANLDISVRLETILCKCGQICASGNALMQLGTIFYKLGQICTTRNASMQLKGYMSLDGY